MTIESYALCSFVCSGYLQSICFIISSAKRSIFYSSLSLSM